MFRRYLNRSRDPQDASLQAELAALADGALDRDAAERVMRRVASQPALDRELADQQRIAAALRRADIGAPPHLHQHVQEMALAASLGVPTGRGPRRGSGRLLALTGGLAGVAAVFVLVQGGEGAPTVGQAAALGLRAPTGAAPSRGADGRHLAIGVPGLAFPDWSPGWRAVGQRSDRLAGRLARTVLYVDGRGRRVGYVIVAGTPLATVAGRSYTVAFVSYRARLRSGVVSVSWRQAGHTCVLVSRSLGPRALISLAGAPRRPLGYPGAQHDATAEVAPNGSSRGSRPGARPQSPRESPAAVWVSPAALKAARMVS